MRILKTLVPLKGRDLKGTVGSLNPYPLIVFSNVFSSIPANPPGVFFETVHILEKTYIIPMKFVIIVAANNAKALFSQIEYNPADNIPKIATK